MFEIFIYLTHTSIKPDYTSGNLDKAADNWGKQREASTSRDQDTAPVYRRFGIVVPKSYQVFNQDSNRIVKDQPLSINSTILISSLSFQSRIYCSIWEFCEIIAEELFLNRKPSFLSFPSYKIHLSTNPTFAM